MNVNAFGHMTNTFSQKHASFHFVVEKVVIGKFSLKNDMSNAFDNFYLSPYRFIPLFLLSHCFLGCFRYICQRYLLSAYMSNFFTCDRKRFARLHKQGNLS